jgi:hypothetical protein
VKQILGITLFLLSLTVLFAIFTTAALIIGRFTFWAWTGHLP